MKHPLRIDLLDNWFFLCNKHLRLDNGPTGRNASTKYLSLVVYVPSISTHYIWHIGTLPEAFRRPHSVTKDEAPIFQSFKRSRQQPEPEAAQHLAIPTIIQDDIPFESTSTETIITAFSAPQTHDSPTSNHARYLVSKLDRLHDKKERYQSHQFFLQKCIEENIIPKGLLLELEPSIGNHDEDFLKNWYSKLEEYSKNFMKDVITFC